MLSELSFKLGDASVTTDGEFLVVSTGLIERRWLWTGKGLVTFGLRDVSRGREWADVNPDCVSDWSIPGSDDEYDG